MLAFILLCIVTVGGDGIGVNVPLQQFKTFIPTVHMTLSPDTLYCPCASLGVGV